MRMWTASRYAPSFDDAYRLVPTLITEKKVYIAESPLYEIRPRQRDKIFRLYRQRKRQKITAKLKGKVKIKRSKGLGENAADMMWETTMNPETRRLILVTPDEAERTQAILNSCLGENLSGRKEHIAEEGHKYLDMIDLS